MNINNDNNKMIILLVTEGEVCIQLPEKGAESFCGAIQLIAPPAALRQ